MRWVRRLWHRDRLERELDAELRFHVDEETRRLTAGGAAPDEARRLALAAFGGLEPTKEAARDARGTRWLEDIGHDLRYAARTMRRYPAFTCAAVASLAIGIGANTAIFGVLDALLIRPLPVAAPADLSYVVRTGPLATAQSLASNARFSYGALIRYREALEPARAAMAAMSSVVRMQLTVAGRDDQTAELVLGQLVAGDWFGVLGVGARTGRVLTAGDDATVEGRAVAVLSDGYWARRFARDPAVVGSTILVNRYPLTVVGVAAPKFDGFVVGEPVDVWMPTALQQQLAYNTNADVIDADTSKPWRPQDGIAWLTLIARVPSSIPARTAAAAVDVAFRRDVEARAGTVQDPRLRAYILQTHVTLASGARGMSTLRQEFGTAVMVLMATVALVLMVACANLANLLAARGAARSREFALRLSLGARRGRLVRQLLTESLALSLLGGLVSLVFARGASEWLLRLASDGPAPLPLDVSLSWSIVAFAVFASIGTGVLFGVAPALRLSRPDLHAATKSAGHVAGVNAGTSFSRVLVIVQVALSFALVVGALLFVRTLHNLLAIDPGFEARHLITARFDPRMAGYAAATMSSLRERLLDGARAVPGAEIAAVAMCGTLANCHSISDIDVPGRQRGVGDDADVQEDYVNAEYFPALAMTFVAGRNFSEADTPQTPRVAIVNEAMARHFFGDVSPIGRYFVTNGKVQIVGIVRDSRINGLRETPPRMAFYPFTQNPARPMRNLYIRVKGDVGSTGQQLRAAIGRADRGIAVREVVTLADLEQRSIARERLVSTLTGAFGLLAVAVACLGLYAMVSYSVTQRTNEIGIRLALGASAASISWLVLRETVLLVGAGIAAGLVVFVPGLRVIGSLLYGLSPHDPLTVVAAIGLLAIVATLGALAPAWRASHVDPALALRID